MKTVTLDNTVGELVRLNPRTARAFKDLGIDFCCGGKKSLREVCNSKSLEPDDRIGPLGFERLDHQLDQLMAEAAKLFGRQVERNVGMGSVCRHAISIACR